MKIVQIYKQTVALEHKNTEQKTTAFAEKSVFQAFHANRFMLRLRGLLGRPPLQENQGLLLTPCAQIHTLGMTYPLDILFLDKAKTVTKCVSDLKPNRLTASVKAHHALELQAGQIKHHQIKVGDQLNWKEQD